MWVSYPGWEQVNFRWYSQLIHSSWIQTRSKLCWKASCSAIKWAGRVCATFAWKIVMGLLLIGDVWRRALGSLPQQ